MSDDLLRVISNGGPASAPRWIPSWARRAMTVLPVGLGLGVGVSGYVVRSSSATLELGIGAVLLAAVWFFSTKEPLLLGAIVVLGIDVAVATSGRSDTARDVAACVAGSLLYLIHSSATLSGAIRGDVLVDARVLQRWAKRNLPIACVSLAGLLAALGSRAAGDDRLILAVAAIVVGFGSLLSLWLLMLGRSRTTDRALHPPTHGVG